MDKLIIVWECKIWSSTANKGGERERIVKKKKKKKVEQVTTAENNFKYTGLQFLANSLDILLLHTPWTPWYIRYSMVLECPKQFFITLKSGGEREGPEFSEVKFRTVLTCLRGR